MKITRVNGLFTFLLFFSSTIFPLIIEDITDKDQKSDKKLPQSDSHPTSEKMGKNFHRTETESPTWKAIDISGTIYIVPQNNGLNPPSDLLRAIRSDIAEKSMPPLCYNNNVPFAIPADKNHLNTTKLPLVKKVPPDQQNEHRNTQSIRNLLAKLNQESINSWGPPLL